MTQRTFKDCEKCGYHWTTVRYRAVGVSHSEEDFEVRCDRCEYKWVEPVTSGPPTPPPFDEQLMENK
jgi:hypothetical protein